MTFRRFSDRETVDRMSNRSILHTVCIHLWTEPKREHAVFDRHFVHSLEFPSAATRH
jgi:hypothetical protein